MKTILTCIGLVWLLSSCASVPVEQMPSVNYSHRVKFLVLHFTAINYEQSVRVLVEPDGLSSHYLVPESGDPTYTEDELRVYQLVDEKDRAWHAGASFWQGREDLNDQSIGIEIVNVPECKRLPQGQENRQVAENSPERFCFFPDYDPKQINLLVDLIKDILQRNPDIGPTQIVGHADIAPSRKNDPGPRFPWFQLYQQGIGAWYETQTVEKYWQIFSGKLPNTGLVQAALRRYGYGVIETGVMDQDTVDALSAFQMHFLPWQVNGQADAKTVATLFALLDRYMPNRIEHLLARYEREMQPEPSPFEPQFGQIDQTYPIAEEQRSSRELVNDKALFKAYRGRGEIIIDSLNATSALIEVNGQQLNIAQPMTPGERYQYSLARRTRDGDNTIAIRQVEPAGAEVNIRIPYPQLREGVHNRFDFSQVDAQIEQDIELGFPGAVLLVIKDGEVIKRSAYGYARKFADGGAPLSTPVPMRPETLFDLASNTKMFATNFAVMKLVNEKQLDVRKPLMHYLPEYRGAGRESRTVYDLLTHQAGYAPQVRFFSEDNAVGSAFFSQNDAQTKELLLRRVPFIAGKGLKRAYSDTDYMLLGMLVERITGQSLDNYVEQQIYQPLGLQHTLFNPLDKGFSKGEFAATEIHGTSRGGRVDYPNIRDYVLQGEVHDEKAWHSLAGVAGHAGLFSNVDDMAVLLQTMLNRGGYGQLQLFSGQVVDQFIGADLGNGSFGLGWRRANSGDLQWHFGPYASEQAYGHTGWTGTVTVIDPKYDLAIVMLTNARHSEIVDNEKGYEFLGKQFETGRYGSIITLIYEAILND